MGVSQRISAIPRDPSLSAAYPFPAHIAPASPCGIVSSPFGLLDNGLVAGTVRPAVCVVQRRLLHGEPEMGLMGRFLWRSVCTSGGVGTFGDASARLRRVLFIPKK
jgi:hypothetical protein